VAALTDQAIAEIKNLIMSGEFVAGSRLPKEQDLAQRLGLSRNSLREAVRALSLIGVLEPRVGDGTYVTSLEPELLLTGMGFISDLLSGSTLLELHQVRRILEPVATELATTQLDESRLHGAREVSGRHGRGRDDAGVHRGRRRVPPHRRDRMRELDAGVPDPEPVRRTLRARLWRSVKERDAIEVTKRRHWDIYNALRDRDAKRAAAADLIHLSEGEQWLRQLMQAEDALTVLATAPPDTGLSGNGDESAGSTP
jgi:GntR family transcriptional repressor for pyruvate dehydrogenase complex